MSYNVTLIPGDGIGPEVTEAARRVLEATGVAFQWINMALRFLMMCLSPSGKTRLLSRAR